LPHGKGGFFSYHLFVSFLAVFSPRNFIDKGLFFIFERSFWPKLIVFFLVFLQKLGGHI